MQLNELRNEIKSRLPILTGIRNYTNITLNKSNQFECIWHDDSTASATVYPAKNDGHCFGCGTDGVAKHFDIIDLVGYGQGLDHKATLDFLAKELNINTEPVKRKEISRTIDKIYDYTDADNNLVYQAIKQIVNYNDGTQGKGFFQRQPNSKGGWINNINGIEPLPYQLPALLAGIKQRSIIYIGEGEKCVETLRQSGLIATTNSGGAGRWTESHSKYFPTNVEVVILPDNDDDGNKFKGQKHGESIASQLYSRGCKVKVIHLAEYEPQLPIKGDIVEWLAMGHTAEELVDIVGKVDYWESKANTANSVFNTNHELENESDNAIPWPDDLNISAFHGLAGEIIKTISPHTEADESALLANFLVAFGNCIGRNAHFEVSGDTHYTNLFCSLVGVSAGGKKGTSWGYINKLFRTVDEFWTNEKVTSGLSSGEGLIWAIRDTIYKKKRKKKAKPSAVIPEYEEDNEDDLEIEVDGVPDKRILLNESEFGGKVLQSFKREGNTLSGVLREAWDCKYILQSLTKGEKAKTTKGHISMIGHVTKAELLSKMDEVEMMNGLGNRILWVCCRQSKQLPLGGNLSDDAIEELALKLLDTIEFSKTVGNMQFDPSVYEIWSNVYSKLSEPKAGIVGAGLARAVPQVRRLACIYALLDKSDIVRLEHIKAALAFWTRCEQSVEYIFGKSATDPVIEKMIICLSEGDKSQTEINKYFQKHLSAKVIRIALENLSAGGKVICYQEKSKGRPATKWQLVKK